MNIDRIIQHLRAHCPSFQGRVAGAAEFSQGVEQVSTMASPAAFVIPLEDDAEQQDNPEVPGLWQAVTERIGIVVQVSNRADRRGQLAADQVYPIRTELFRAILNWRPGVTIDGGPSPDADLPPDQIASASGFQYAGGQLLDFDRARLFWQFDFTLRGYISDADGFQVTGHDLEAIDVRATDPESGDETGAGAKIVFP